MGIKAGSLVKIPRVANSPTGAGPADADALPTGVLIRNGDDTAEVVTVTHVATPGRYKVVTTIPAAWEVGDEVSIALRGTSGGVPFDDVCWEETIDSGAYTSSLAGPGAYCTRADMEIRFGDENVEKWADMNNSGIAGEISARIEWAIAQAYSDINDEMRGGPYELPIESPPTSLVDLAARWAAALLHESRALLNKAEEGESGGPELKPLRRKIARINAGIGRLDGVAYEIASYPQVVEDDEIDEQQTVAIIISSD